MMLLVRSLTMNILLLLSIFSLSTVTPQSDTVLPISPARELDTLLQGYAYKVLDHPKTGVSVSAERLSSESFKTRGVKKYKEFVFPKGITVSPYVETLVLVYQNLGNWSKAYYDLPGYTYLSPVLGFLAYDAFNLSATNLPELSIRVSGDPIEVHFTNAKSPPSGSVPMCVSINLNGSVAFSSVIPGNICLVRDQGHFSLAIESIALSPAANAPVSPPEKSKTKAWIIAAYVLGGLTLVALLVFLVWFVMNYIQQKRLELMDRAAEEEEHLLIAEVDDTRLPYAAPSRTRPVLEDEIFF